MSKVFTQFGHFCVPTIHGDALLKCALDVRAYCVKQPCAFDTTIYMPSAE